MSNYDTQEINRLIVNRRSVYPTMYSGEIINDDIINQILENANWAPTHRLTEPWRFTVFTGKGLNTLAEFQSNLYKQKSEANESFDENKFLKLLNKPLLSVLNRLNSWTGFVA